MGILREGITLDQIPMPPSENEAYATYQGRRICTRELNEFKSRFQAWSLRRALPLARLIDELKWELADHRKALRVDAYLFFQYDSLFTKPQTKTERPRRKKMDPSNRCKALYDCLAAMLAIDDSRLIPGETLPILRTDPVGQFARVNLSLVMIKTDEEFEASFKRGHAI